MHLTRDGSRRRWRAVAIRLPNVRSAPFSQNAHSFLRAKCKFDDKQAEEKEREKDLHKRTHASTKAQTHERSHRRTRVRPCTHARTHAHCFEPLLRFERGEPLLRCEGESLSSCARPPLSVSNHCCVGCCARSLAISPALPPVVQAPEDISAAPPPPSGDDGLSGAAIAVKRTPAHACAHEVDVHAVTCM
eukprot:4691909-Pleurochrysis_carterae.AAC.1